MKNSGPWEQVASSSLGSLKKSLSCSAWSWLGRWPRGHGVLERKDVTTGLRSWTHWLRWKAWKMPLEAEGMLILHPQEKSNGSVASRLPPSWSLLLQILETWGDKAEEYLFVCLFICFYLPADRIKEEMWKPIEKEQSVNPKCFSCQVFEHGLYIQGNHKAEELPGASGSWRSEMSMTELEESELKAPIWSILWFTKSWDSQCYKLLV